MLNPQEQHGVNNVLLRALLAKHPATKSDPEHNAHIHINNLAWAIPKSPVELSAPPSPTKIQAHPQAYTSSSSEDGETLVASNEHIYLETEKHIVCIANDWLATNSKQILTQEEKEETLEELREELREKHGEQLNQINLLAKEQNKQALFFYIKDDEETLGKLGKLEALGKLGTGTIESEIFCHLTSAELHSEVRKILHASRGAINIPGNNDSNQCLQLLDDLLQKPFSSGAGKSNQAQLDKLHKEFAPSLQAPPVYPRAEAYLKRLQQLRDHQNTELTKQKITAHCWLWYPLKFANRHLAQGLPFVVYEIRQPAIGKITVDLHYHIDDNTDGDTGKNYWRMDVFRRPGRQGMDVQHLLQECGIDYYDIDKHKNYVPKYIVLKLDEADNLQEPSQLTQAASTLQQQVDSIIHKLINYPST